MLELEEFVRDHIVIILVAVGDETDAYMIFETLNDRGLDLSISDLLKNYIFGKAGNRLPIVQKQWNEMVFMLGTQNETQFLRHYWLSKYGVVRERDLYSEMKRKFASQNAVLNLMSELREAADKYSAISNVDHSIWQGYGASMRRNLETLQLFSLTQFRPLLLAALDLLEQEEIEKVVNILVVISMRYSIIGTLGTGNLEKAYSDAAVQIRDGKARKAAKVFSILKGIYPDDEKFKSDFAQREITKPKIARYILSAIANLAQGSKEVVVLEDEKIVNLEHIMPKTRTKDWLNAASDEAEYQAYVNRIGNLTLIEREKNHTAGTALFNTKKADAYSKSSIVITKSLARHNNWNTTTIGARQEEFAKLAIQVWSLPY